MQLTEMILKARNLMAIPTGTEDNAALAATAMKNLEDYGFTFGKEGFDMLKTASKKEITDWYYQTADLLNRFAGGNHTYEPFYLNFPEQVMNANELDLFFDQIAHYTFGYRPEDENEKENIKSIEEHELKVLGVYDANEPWKTHSIATDIFKNYLKAKGNLSPAMFENVACYIENVPDWTKNTDTVANRNLLCTLYAAAIADGRDTSSMPSLVTKDYLRIASIATVFTKQKNPLSEKMQDSFEYLTGTDKYHVKSLPRRMRTFIVKGLDQQKNLAEDVARAKPQFKALFRSIHAGEYQKQGMIGENFADVIDALRNNGHIETFYGRVQRKFDEKDVAGAIGLLKTRPGEFIKNINKIIIAETDQPLETLKALADASKEVFPKARTEDLISLITYLRSREDETRLNIHNVKGMLYLDEKQQPKINKDLAETMIEQAKKAIEGQLSCNKAFGTVYVDPAIRNVPLPVGLKDVSGSMCAYPRGTVTDIEKNEDGTPKNSRFSIWWTNTGRGECVDLDLSTRFYSKVTALEGMAGKEFIDREGRTIVNKGHLGYSTSHNVLGCVHSGDITNGGPVDGKGACEYIDLDFNALREHGIDYVQVFVNSFSGQPFSELPNCEFAVQQREELDKSKQFDIRAVKQHSKMQSPSRGITPAVIDVEKGQVIWLDAPEYTINRCENANSRAAISTMEYCMEKYTKGNIPTMGELIDIAVKANIGSFTDDITKADTIFSLNNPEDAREDQRVITAKDTDVWLGEFMSPQNMPAKEQIEITEEKQEETKPRSIQELLELEYGFAEEILGEEMASEELMDMDTPQEAVEQSDKEQSIERAAI